METETVSGTPLFYIYFSSKKLTRDSWKKLTHQEENLPVTFVYR